MNQISRKSATFATLGVLSEMFCRREGKMSFWSFATLGRVSYVF